MMFKSLSQAHIPCRSGGSVVSIRACHTTDPSSNTGQGDIFSFINCEWMTNSSNLKFFMLVNDVINDLHTNFQTSIVFLSKENRLRVSRFSKRYFDTFRSDIAKMVPTAFEALELSFPMVPTIWKNSNHKRRYEFLNPKYRFLRKTLPAHLPEALWRHSDVIGQNKFQIRNLLW